MRPQNASRLSFVIPAQAGIQGPRLRRWPWIPASAGVYRASKREPGAEDQRGVEIEFGVERALDRLGAAEAVLLAGEQQVGDRDAAAAQRLDHHLGLVRRHDTVLGALEENHRAAQPVGMGQRRALAVEV